MPLMKFKPTSAGRRSAVRVVTPDLHKGAPHAALVESQGKTGLGIYPDGMVEHDMHVGQLLKVLDDLGIANDTVVMYSTDNGPHRNSWPDGGMTPFRSEKNSNWEGAYRVPAFVRWPAALSYACILSRRMNMARALQA